MTSQIDPTLPVYGTPTTASVRANFQTAHDEITALQAGAAAITAPQVAISPAIGVLGPNVQTGLAYLNTNAAPINSPVFQGDPQAPTASPGDNDQSLATTAFVQAAVAKYLPLTGGSLTGPLATTNMSASGVVFGAQGVYANADSTLALHDAGATRNLSFSSASEWSWNATTALLTWLVGGLSAFTIDVAGNVVAHGTVSGNGAYINTSDMRMKQDVEPASVGLDEILRLEPINFTRIPSGGAASLPAPRTEIGFSAQQVAGVIPEAVQAVMVERPDGGGMTDDDPTLGVQCDPIVAALVNAVKALAGRVAALEATEQ